MATHVIDNSRLARRDGRLPLAPALLMWIEKAAHNLLMSWAWYDTYRQNARELNRLSDRELDDIGIARHEIPTIALKSANETVEQL